MLRGAASLEQIELKPFRNWLLSIAVLLIAYSFALIDLIRLSLHNELYSHLALVPFASVLLVWVRRHELPRNTAPLPRSAILPTLGGLGLLVGYVAAIVAGVRLTREDSLAWITLSLVLLLVGTTARLLGRDLAAALRFPLAFLVFMAPFPTGLREGIESGLQRGSGDVAHLFFSLAGVPVFRDNNTFQLPNITLTIASECSGIHSTLALLITSVVAGYLLLHSQWKRFVLAAVVLPVALLRNGLRVFTIGKLCIHDPAMIDSYIHRHGGPVFFALSLIPFGFILLLLVKSERNPTAPRRELMSPICP